MKRPTIPGPADLCPSTSTGDQFDPSSSSSSSQQQQQSIFFIESSGEACLTARQACSIESAARSNPDLAIRVHIENEKRPLKNKKKETKKAAAGQTRSCTVTDSLKNLANVQLVYENLEHHLKDTPLWSLQSKGRLNESLYPLMHWSDAARVAILWRKGGIYMDLDVIVLRPVRCLRNTVGLVDYIPNWVENGVMGMIYLSHLTDRKSVV